MPKWENMHVNTKHALEMEMKSYKYPPYETMIQEIIANSQDAFNNFNTKNPTIEINLQKIDNNNYIIFNNNSDPIPLEFFKEKYQTLYESSKTIGKQIGFVGIGAKIFLPSHKNAEIITITGDEKKYASKWKYTNHGPEYAHSLKDPISDIVNLKKFPHECGTTFICRLSNDQYLKLQSNLKNIIHFWWNYAIYTKLFNIKINGKILEHKFPSTEAIFKINTTIQGHPTKLTFLISENELDEDHQNIVYVAHGKRIENEKLETELSIKNNFGKKIFCYVDVGYMAKYVIKSKEGFEKNRPVSQIKNKIHNRFWKFVKDQNLYEDKIKNVTKNIELEILAKKLNKALQSEKFKDLNPFLAMNKRKTIISSNDGNETVSETDGSQKSNSDNENNDNNRNGTAVGDNHRKAPVLDDKADKLGNTKYRKTRGINISEIEHDEIERRESYVSEEHNAVIINIGHPFYKKNIRSSIAEFHKYRIVIEALIRYQASVEQWNVDVAFDKARELLHDIYD
ncbi:MAG: hypothetical protein K8823_987 [Cenarchaeum symbiont of Oopsacas minuta]|nr:hypothetical protein [Cenarchaeum symbiont of Oopsacas minuta]